MDNDIFDLVQEIGQHYYKFFREHKINIAEMRADKLRSDEYKIHQKEYRA